MGRFGRAARKTGLAALPQAAIIRFRVRVTLDLLVALFVTVLALALAVGYQVIRFFGGRAGDVEGA